MNDTFWATELKQMKTAMPGWAPAAIGGVVGAGTGAISNYLGQREARDNAIYDHPDQATAIDAVPTDRMSVLKSGLDSGLLSGLAGGFLSPMNAAGVGVVGGSLLGGLQGDATGRHDVRSNIVSRAREAAAG